jgi:hypothetical protein
LRVRHYNCARIVPEPVSTYCFYVLDLPAFTRKVLLFLEQVPLEIN